MSRTTTGSRDGRTSYSRHVPRDADDADDAMNSTEVEHPIGKEAASGSSGSHGEGFDRAHFCDQWSSGAMASLSSCPRPVSA